MGFSTKLSAQAVSAEVTRKFSFAPITLDRGKTNPVLEVRVAGRANKTYWNLELKEPDTRAMAAGAQTDASEAYGLELHLKRIARGGVVVSWANVFDDDDVASPCTPEKVEELLLALLVDGRERDKLWEFVVYVRNSDLFRPPTISAEALGKG